MLIVLTLRSSCMSHVHTYTYKNTPETQRHTDSLSPTAPPSQSLSVLKRLHTLAYVSIRQQTSAYFSRSHRQCRLKPLHHIIFYQISTFVLVKSNYTSTSASGVTLATSRHVLMYCLRVHVHQRPCPVSSFTSPVTSPFYPTFLS
jgi:hypothetical protein